ncbi:efflux RND transporter permease subunit [Agarilytica rhodophyticola]|uniref:efflux RND transporter permease subunit n=1 Tax=Agarilytica rhodophyticola TaxID=1737490 RepID=UPI000B343BB3|nr:efflux RND transporter permease subunit [Agarilytica rhodophyticola]
MSLTASALKNPAAAAVGVAILLFFGVFSLSKLPIQLFPDIENPQISIQTGWRGASPKEVESEIVEPIEDVLQGLPGVKEMSANANSGFAWINLQFDINTDMQEAMLSVISRMNRLPPLPRDANPPTVSLGGGGGGTPALTWFFLQVLPGNDQSIEDYVPFAENVIRPRIEAISGVSRVSVGGGNDAGAQELVIEFDPQRAAQLNISIPSVAASLGQSEDISAGFVNVERRRYMVRFAGRFTPEQLSAMVLDWRDGRPILLGDIADVEVKHIERNSLGRQNGNPAIGIRIDRQSGANVLETLTRVKAEVERIREDVLAPKGLDMQQSFDASVFIYRAINLVTGNLFAGVFLAVGVLWWFLRRFRATLIVAMAIPISLLGTFIVLSFVGRTLNVISLAGLAFAVGMVLDAAIVVLENVVRLREKGEQPMDAALKGANQVWGALLASTATTVAIFVPVVFLKDIEGQLFGDLALTIAIAVVISLIVAVAVVPLASKQWLKEAKLKDHHEATWHKITSLVMALTSTARKRWALIGGLMAVPALLTYLLLPELDYLPPVKRDAVDTFFQYPPATNIDVIEKDVIAKIEERMQPYMDGVKEPALKNYYIFVWPGGTGGSMGARVKDQSKVGMLEKVIKEEITADIPDVRAFSAQGNLFGRFGGDRSIPIHIQSRDTEAVRSLARDAMGWLNEALPEAQVRPEPSLQQAEPELRLLPNDRSIQEKGWSRREIASVVRTMGNGMYVGEYFDGVRRLDIILKAKKWPNPEALGTTPIATANGSVVPLNELVDVTRTVGPDRINRVDRRRTTTLIVSPPENMSLERALNIIKTEVAPKIVAALPEDGNIHYGGSADSLKKALATMSENFFVALGILFLLMSALFRSLKDSLLVILAMPLATVGGVIALQLLNLISFQPLDLLTMIGFIILLGLVVNNAILLVHQTRSAEREGVSRHHAVEQALRLRLRPIFMSTLTSIFGMLPLLIMPGEGSVIYRGLAAVIVGGMSISTIFTLVLLPCFLRMGESSPKLISSGDPKDPTIEKRKLEVVA